MNTIVDLQLEGVIHWIGCQFAHAMSAKFKAFSFLTINLFRCCVKWGGTNTCWHINAHNVKKIVHT